MLTLLREEPRPRMTSLPGRRREGFLVAGPTACMRCTAKTHTDTHTHSRQMMLRSCSISIPVDVNHCQRVPMPLQKGLLTASGRVWPPFFFLFVFFCSLLMTRLKKYLMLTAISSAAHQRRKAHLKMVPCY